MFPMHIENMDHHAMMSHNTHHEMPIVPQTDHHQTITMKILYIKDHNGKKIVQIQLNRIKDNHPITFSDHKEMHTRKIHLLIIDDALEDYSHIHPKQISKNGIYEFE